ncbi:MAG: response regulator [Bacteroidales bacterium]|nr:response regulator [Bacteroidales bacterium]
MKYIIIDDNQPFADELCKLFSQNKENCNREIVQIKLSENYDDLNALADSLIYNGRENKDENKISDDIILFINVNLKMAGKQRQDQIGIELLKWLRLKNCYNHSVLYSFQEFLSILKEPLNSIILSTGTSFIHLPFAIDEIKQLDCSSRTEKNNLLPYFRAEIDLVKIRHELANKWGLYRMNWILDLIEGETSERYENFYILILTYLTQEIHVKELPKELLKERIEEFKANTKDIKQKIFLYDDCAIEWIDPLKRLLGENIIEAYDPTYLNQEGIIKEIIKEKPGCILLDLRLENEKDVLEVLNYSGGKLLTTLKDKFKTLPVIMFTATNKAQSVRRLLSAGAEYVWTKEGIDDGIDNLRTLYNLIELINEIEKALLKFKNETYRQIYEAEVLCKKIVKNNNLPFPKGKYIIYIDTNYLINSVKRQYFNTFYKLLINKPDNWNIKIHEDVVKEILVISQQDENKDNNNYRVPVCRFLLQEIMKWQQNKYIYIEWLYGQADAIKEQDGIVKKTTKDLNEIEVLEERVNETSSFFQRLFYLLEKNKEDGHNTINEKIKEVNDAINTINTTQGNFSQIGSLKLHADETFIKALPKELNYGNAILVTDDQKCAFNVGHCFNNNKEYTIKQQYYYSLGENNRQGAPQSVTKKINNFTNIYSHYFNSFFNKLIVTWCNPSN